MNNKLLSVLFAVAMTLFFLFIHAETFDRGINKFLGGSVGILIIGVLIYFWGRVTIYE